jgi:uncharacterized membrane protein
MAGHGFFPNGMRPFLYRDGVVQDLGTLGIPGNVQSFTAAINEGGMVVGFEANSEFTSIHSWYWTQASGLQPTGMTRGVVRDVNDNGQILIGSRIWQNGLVTNLPDARVLHAINNAGHVIGLSNSTNDYKIWRNGVGYRIQDLLEPGHEMAVDGALDINNAGQLLVGGTRNGVSNYYLLNPVPEPASLFAFGAGLALLIRRRRR